jgi:uncharacterized protein YqfA (UPF0365 family)
MPDVLIFILIIAIIIFVISTFFSFVPIGLWISAYAAGVKIGIFTLVGMRLRRVVPARIVNPMIKAVKAGLDASINKLEAHYLAGGNVDKVVNALIAAERANIPLEFERAAAIDLAGRDVLEAVQMSVNPRVIETPIIAAIAKDGIELKAKARVTVRANIDRLVGGAGEQTIIARVGEGIVTTVGSSHTHKEVLENPDLISKTVLEKGLDSGTAFEILSIDIADIDVGRNIGAQLQTDQAEADKRIAQAKAEERRAMAVAPRKYELIKEDIEKIRENVDIIIISLHWGVEDSFEVTEEQKEFAHNLIDDGADIILGHHPHKFQGIEIYEGKPIVYSMGNFIFDQNDPLKQESFIVDMEFINNKLTSLELLPVRTISKTHIIIPKGEEAKELLKRELELCGKLGSKCAIVDDKIVFNIKQ